MAANERNRDQRSGKAPRPTGGDIENTQEPLISAGFVAIGAAIMIAAVFDSLGTASEHVTGSRTIGARYWLNLANHTGGTDFRYRVGNDVRTTSAVATSLCVGSIPTRPSLLF